MDDPFADLRRAREASEANRLSEEKALREAAVKAQVYDDTVRDILNMLNHAVYGDDSRVHVMATKFGPDASLVTLNRDSTGQLVGYYWTLVPDDEDGLSPDWDKAVTVQLAWNESLQPVAFVCSAGGREVRTSLDRQELIQGVNKLLLPSASG